MEFRLATDFDAQNMRAVMISPDRAIASYSNTFKGRQYQHVREIYRDKNSDTWHPGKGLSMIEAESKAILAAIVSVAMPLEKPKFVPESRLIPGPGRKIKIGVSA
jgi:hypothetical protein